MQIVREIPSVADSREDLRNERLFESVHDVVRFEQLLATAERLCLREAPQYPEYSAPVNNEAKLIDRVGALGVRYALESTWGERNGFEPFDEALPHPLREPELYTGPRNRRLLAKATAFGEALIGESYTVLGTDAEAWVEEFKAAENDEAQIAILDKLGGRLSELAVSDRGLEEGGNDYYQSLRLSPKVIGEYPDYTVPPTCLGIAAIGAGFLKKAGATYLHAGVMETAYQTRQMELGTVIDFVQRPDVIQGLEISLSDATADRLKEKATELYQAAMADIGAHSALFIRLSSGSWYQFDPMYGISVQTLSTIDENDTVEPRDDQLIDRAYQKLTELQAAAPGLELSVSFPSFSFYQGWPEYLAGRTPIDDETAKRLIFAADEPVVESIRNFMINEWLLYETEDFFASAMQDVYLKGMVYPAEEDGGEEKSVLDLVVRDAINDFIFQDVPADEWVERCRSDEAFRRNAVEDIKRLPVLIGIRFGFEIIEATLNPIHTKVELGLPETSIGLAALHNIGLDLESELSAHHWLSQWPSHLMPHDMLYKASRSPLQQQVVRRHTERLTQNGGLAFIHTYVTMMESQENNTHNLVRVEESGEVSDEDQGSSTAEADRHVG